MKFSIVSALGLLFLLSVLFIDSVQNHKEFRELHKAYYITPKQLSTQDISPCIKFQYHNNSFICSVMTLNELVNYRDTNASANSHSIIYRIHRLVVFLSGQHYVNNTSRQQWSDKPFFNGTFVGIGNVTITCVSNFLFLFRADYITMTNIHFNNCSGKSRSMLHFNFTGRFNNVSLTKLVITSGENIAGIKVTFTKPKKYKRQSQFINLLNSVISTGSGVGVDVYDDRILKKTTKSNLK